MSKNDEIAAKALGQLPGAPTTLVKHGTNFPITLGVPPAKSPNPQLLTGQEWYDRFISELPDREITYLDTLEAAKRAAAIRRQD